MVSDPPQAVDPNSDAQFLTAGQKSLFCLVVQDGKYSRAELKLNYGEYLIGRAANSDIHLQDPNISARHLRLYLLPQGIIVEDLNSDYGTYLNSVPLLKPSWLHPGQSLQLGPTSSILFVSVPAGSVQLTEKHPVETLAAQPITSPNQIPTRSASRSPSRPMQSELPKKPKRVRRRWLWVIGGLVILLLSWIILSTAYVLLPSERGPQRAGHPSSHNEVSAILLAQEKMLEEADWFSTTQPVVNQVSMGANPGYEIIYRGELALQTDQETIAVDSVYIVYIDAVSGEVFTFLSP